MRATADSGSYTLRQMGLEGSEIIFKTQTTANVSGVEAMRIDTSQRVLIGLTTSEAVASVTAADLQVVTGGIGASIVSTAGAVGPSGVLALGHKRGAGGIVLDGDGLGDIRFAGHDGTDLDSQAAIIRASVDGTPGSNDMPGRLQFYTTADGAASATERMRISSSGQVNIGDNMVVYANPNLQIRSEDNTAISASDIWDALNKPGIDVRNSSNTLFSYAGINFFGGTSGNSYAGINMVQTTANSKGALTFWTGGNGEGSPFVYERLRIHSDGVVAINTTSNSSVAKLQVNGGADGSGILTGRTDGGNGNNERFVITGFADGGGANYGGGIGFETRNTTNTFIEAMRIDSSQRVLIGHTSSIPSGGDEQKFQVTGVGSSDGISLNRFNTNYGAYFTFGRAGDANIGTYVAVPTNDDIGRIQFAVADGTDMTSIGAMILSTTEAEAASNDTPANLRFLTTSDGNQSPTERMRIDSAGRVMIAGAAGNVNPPTTLMGDMNAAFRVGTSSAQIGSLFKYTYGPNTNVDGAVFQLRAGSNGNAAYIRITVSNYQGVFEAHYYCNNASGNWNVNQATVTDVGGPTAPSLTVAGSGGTSPTITVALNSTSYSGAFLDVTTSSNWQLTLA